MFYFSRKNWVRMESPLFALRVLGALQWQRSSRKYSRALRALRSIAPQSLVEATGVSFGDSIVLGSYRREREFVLELHGSTLSGDERVNSARVQLVLTHAQVDEAPPNGAWIVQEEWSVAAVPDLGEGARFRLRALCTRGHLDVEFSNAELVITEAHPQSEIRWLGRPVENELEDGLMDLPAGESGR
jgi:hypothetical protein